MSTTPEGFVVEQCRTEECRAPIVWARTKNGRTMPVDAEPSADGNVRLYNRQGVVRAHVLTAEEIDNPVLVGDDRLRTSHFATCPGSAGWRVKR